MFDLKIVSETRIIMDEAVKSVIIDGESSEYELLSFHADTVGILRRGDIIIDNNFKVPVLAGVVSFYDNKCLILVQEA